MRNENESDSREEDAQLGVGVGGGGQSSGKYARNRKPNRGNGGESGLDY